MSNNDSQRIVSLISKVVQRRKRFVVIGVVGILIPILFYNETANPIYEASTSFIFEEFSNPVTNYSYDASREILISNRLEEIKSLAFSEDVAKALPLDAYERFEMPADAAEDFDKFSYVSKKINKNISAFSIRGSNVLQISMAMRDPVLCRDVANTAANVFQERMARIKQAGVSGVRSFIEEQVERVQAQLNDAEEELRNFKEQNRIMSVDKESQGLLRKMTEAEVLFNSVKSQRGSVEERLATLESQLSEQKKALVPSITDIATPYAQGLKQSLLALQQRYTELKLQGYDSDHPKLGQIEREIADTKTRLTNEALKIAKRESVVDPLTQIERYVNESYAQQVELETLKAQELALKKTIQGYESQLASLPQKEYSLARLTRQKEVIAKNYMMLLEKREEARISEAEKLANTRIIDRARLPKEPVAPRKKVNIAIGVVLGLLVGFGAAFLREATRTSLDSAEELEQITDWAVLSAIPLIAKISNGMLARSANGKGKSPMIKRSLLTELDTKTPIAETYRMLRTNMQFNGLGRSFKTILVTSMGPDEGKSTTLTNLAITLSKLDQKVLIVDSDLRRPQMHALFEIDKEPGLADLLVYHNAMKDDTALIDSSEALVEKAFKDQEMGDLVDNFSDFVMDNNFVSKINNLAGLSNLNILNSSLVEAVQSTGIDNLKVLTSGKQLKNPSETVASISMKALLEELKNRFDVILIDSAPLLLVPETMIISSLVDGVLFVVDSQKYNQEMLSKAKNMLKKAEATVIGSVLNKVEITKQNRETYYYYDA